MWEHRAGAHPRDKTRPKPSLPIGLHPHSYQEPRSRPEKGRRAREWGLGRQESVFIKEAPGHPLGSWVLPYCLPLGSAA